MSSIFEQLIFNLRQENIDFDLNELIMPLHPSHSIAKLIDVGAGKTNPDLIPEHIVQHPQGFGILELNALLNPESVLISGIKKLKFTIYKRVSA